MTSWPGKLNGRIPLSEMVDVVGDGDESHYLNPAAAYWWKRMVEDCFAATGVRLGTNEAYRSIATQELYAGPNSPLPPGIVFASPGTSKHGWGLANDITGYNAAWNWLQTNAWRYGWDWAEGKASGERWHWVYIGSLDTTGLDLEEDDMFSDLDRYSAKLVLESQARVEKNSWQMMQWLNEGGKASIMGKLDLCLFLLQGNKPTDPSIKKVLADVQADVQKILDQEK